MNVKLYIREPNMLYEPIVAEEINWETERKGTAGKLTFKVLQDKVLKISNGQPVTLQVDNKSIFHGFIFSYKFSKDHMVSVTAYDQLRYFKNKDTYVYEDKTLTEIIQMLADDFHLQTGSMTDTKYKIPSRIEDNKTLFDIVNTAYELTMENTNQIYVLYDDFGKLTLKNLAEMRLNLLLDEETGQTYDFSSSIDTNTYNQIKLTYENKETGKRDVYIAQDNDHVNRWGVLQHFDKLNQGENGQTKADALLKLYNKETKKLSIKNAFGDARVRGGSLLPVLLQMGNEKVQHMMLVERCKHMFKHEEHYMDLTLRGGDFVG